MSHHIPNSFGSYQELAESNQVGNENLKKKVSDGYVMLFKGLIHPRYLFSVFQSIRPIDFGYLIKPKGHWTIH